ncbi:MAG: glycosyltransferase [Chloroflexota bacterium]|nr:glycosyltransferase [Chloroflexota bacterium]
MRTLVIIPTYNELGNIDSLVDQLLALKPGVDVLIVDDNSPDGTGRTADLLALQTPRVRVLHRAGKLGLGTAYVAGFAYALDRGYERVVEMDADFSHRPQDLPVSVAMILVAKAPVPVAILSFLPLYALGFQFVFSLVGLVEFTQSYQLRLTPRDIIVFAAGFLPYQMLLGLGALRAVYRVLRGATNWEKTEHTGAHREQGALRPAPNPVLSVDRAVAQEQVVDAA